MPRKFILINKVRCHENLSSCITWDATKIDYVEWSEMPRSCFINSSLQDSHMQWWDANKDASSLQLFKTTTDFNVTANVRCHELLLFQNDRSKSPMQNRTMMNWTIAGWGSTELRTIRVESEVVKRKEGRE